MLGIALAVPAVPVLTAGPAHALDNVICVNLQVAECGTSAMSISAAIALANANTVDDLVLVGPGGADVYDDGPYVLTGSTHGITLRGSGVGVTTITAPPSAASQNYLVADGAVVEDLTVRLDPAQSSGDAGIVLGGGAAAHRVAVDGAGTFNASGVQMTEAELTDAVISMPLDDSNSSGLRTGSGAVVTDSAVSAAVGVLHSGSGPAVRLSRTTIEVSGFAGVSADSGSVEIDDSVVDLTTSVSGTGLLAANFNNGQPETIAITADHVTIVGGGNNSAGVWAYAGSDSTQRRLTSTVTVTNSVIDGPFRSGIAQAGNDGAQGGNSVATLDLSYSDLEDPVTVPGANGTVDVVDGPGRRDGTVNPLFVDAATGDYRLRPDSPLVDQGDPAAGGPPLDRLRNPRVIDGDAVPGAVRDIGAYEFGDFTAPDTSITSGPAGLTNDSTPTFGFTSEAGATFECRVDAGAYSACSSPFTTPVLADGAHTVEVRATDAAANVDPTAASRAFVVDTVGPQTTITKKPGTKVTSTKVKFRFTSEPGVTFECKRDAKAYRPCTSPLRWKVTLGKHVLLVRAVDAAGNLDPTPARYRFKRLPKPEPSGCTGEC